jgi:diadenosine tetraphosphate (Ap4A) HIT family hydrolase
MSRWTDPEAWEALLSAEGCPICRDGGPTSVIAELEASWVVMGEAALPLPGTCALFFRRHAVELHELTAEEGAAFMRDAQRLSRALKSASGAVKMNYEVHGNTIPHLHMHFFPRYPGDPFENAPINPRLAPADDRTVAEHVEIRRRLIAALAPGAGEFPAA